MAPRARPEMLLGPGTSLERPEWIEVDFGPIWCAPSGTRDHFLVDSGINFRVRFRSDFNRSSIHAGQNLIGLVHICTGSSLRLIEVLAQIS